MIQRLWRPQHLVQITMEEAREAIPKTTIDQTDVIIDWLSFLAEEVEGSEELWRLYWLREGEITKGLAGVKIGERRGDYGFPGCDRVAVDAMWFLYPAPNLHLDPWCQYMMEELLRLHPHLIFWALMYITHGEDVKRFRTQKFSAVEVTPGHFVSQPLAAHMRECGICRNHVAKDLMDARYPLPKAGRLGTGDEDPETQKARYLSDLLGVLHGVLRACDWSDEAAQKAMVLRYVVLTMQKHKYPQTLELLHDAFETACNIVDANHRPE